MAAHPDGTREINDTLHSMARAVRDALRGSADALISNETLLRRNILLGDDQIDAAQCTIHRAAIGLLGGGRLLREETRAVLAALTVSLHLERIGDAAATVATLGGDASRLPTPLDTAVVQHLHDMGVAAASMVEQAVEGFAAGDAGAGDRLEAADDVVDQTDRLVFRLVVDLGSDRRYREWGLRMEQISRQFERAADHAVDIARQVGYLTGDGEVAPCAPVESSVTTAAGGAGRASR